MFEAISLVPLISALNHYLSKNKRLARMLIDIVFAPIDGIWQISHDGLFGVLGYQGALVIPMHFGYTRVGGIYRSRPRTLGNP